LSQVPNPAITGKQLHPTGAPQNKLYQTHRVRPLYRSPCLLAIPAYDRKAGLNSRHLYSNRGICLR